MTTVKMAFTAPVAAFRAAVAVCAQVTERRNTIPILSNVLIAAWADGLSVTATDMDISLTATVEGAEVQARGGTTISAWPLLRMLREMPGDGVVSVTYDRDADQYSGRLACGEIEWDFPAMSEDDFPVENNPTELVSFSIAAADMRDILARAEPAISKEETRYYLNGIYLHLRDVDGAVKLAGVATDGHRLIRVCKALDAPQARAWENARFRRDGVILPSKAVRLLVSMLPKAGDNHPPLEMKRTGSPKGADRLVFSLPGITIRSKLIDGTFPDYDRVVPAREEKPIQLDKAQFLRAIRVVSAAATPGRWQPAMKMDLDGTRMMVSSQHSDTGRARMPVTIAYNGKLTEVGFNSTYMRQAVAGFDGAEAVTLHIADRSSPCLIEAASMPDVMSVLMPMRV